ncbi:MAG: fasciclin domain-containing protein [Bacteroidetes bacterium]|nr:fasciclin domain-containing protein [Bacteroidota bacterium]
MKYRLLLAALATLVFFLPMSGCQQAATDQSTTAAVNQPDPYDFSKNTKPNILQIAAESPDHTTLAAAIRAAEMEPTLVSAGPLTVFAPNDAAFAKLPAGTVEELVKPENQRKLQLIITSHASPGTFAGAGLKAGMKLYMATGHYVDVEERDGDMYVNGAKILGTVAASNGVVHVVDSVFLLVD